MLQLVQPLELERQRALRAADLPAERVLPPGREARCSDRADGSVREVRHGVERVVDLAPAHERARRGRDGDDLAHQVAREIDHVRAEVTERAGPGCVGVEAPRIVGHVKFAVKLNVPGAFAVELSG